MKKSKIIAAGFALSMMLAVAACSDKKTEETKADATTTTEETTTEETTAEETTTAEVEETEEVSEETEATNEFGMPVVKVEDYNSEGIKNLIKENETSNQYMLMPMSYEDIDVEGYEEGIAAVDLSNYDTILMLKFDTPENAKAFITEFVEDAGVDLEYTDGADGALTFTASVESEDVTTTMDGSIDADGLMTLTEKGPAIEEDVEAEAVVE